MIGLVIAVVCGSFTTDLKQYPPMPKYDSPEGVKERKKSDDFERKLKKSIIICQKY